MRKQFLVTLVTAVALLAGLGGAMVTTPTDNTGGQVEYVLGQKTDGTLEVKRDGIVLSAAQAGLNPIASWHFGYDIQYRICLADYTPEVTSWDPNLVSQKWSQLVGPTGVAHVTVFYDDMNGNIGSCGGWPLRQRINLYSYGDASDGYCSWTSLSTDNNVITRATVWLNRLADNDQCRETFTLRQNTVSGGVGNALGLAYHVNGNISVMCMWETYREKYAYPQWSDGEAINRRYPNA